MEPVSFAMLAAALRLGSDTSEQALIESYIAAAREWVEDYTGHIVKQREVTDRFDSFGARLPLLKRPVVEVVSVDFLTRAGAELSYIDFEERLTGLAPYLSPSLAGWPPDVRPGSISVTYLAGYEPLEVPARMIQAILLLAAEYYRNRSAGALSRDAEDAVMAMLRSFRAQLV